MTYRFYENSLFPDEMRTGISDATIRNWEKLNPKTTGKLTARANKRKSGKRILPLEYFSNRENVHFVQELLDIVDENELDIFPVIFTLGINLLKKAGIYGKPHVLSVLSEYSDIAAIQKLQDIIMPSDEFDILGLVYQSLLREGRKNITGSYYTPQRIAKNITDMFDFSAGQEFFDPCCGSGAFLLSAAARGPNQIFGIDADKIAVFIAKINLMLKYQTVEFAPQIYCLDYLMGPSIVQQHDIFHKKFDYIATNPPWGAMERHHACGITSKETFSCFFVKAYEQLKNSGIIRFLFPESILNVKVHRDIRKFILDTAGIVSITTYGAMFSGVATKYIDIECGNRADKDSFTLYSDKNQRRVSVQTVYETENLVFNLLNSHDVSIVRAVKGKGRYSLKDSIWALGIVTGDNNGKLFSEPHEGMEKIYTGKEIQPFFLKPAKHYLLYDRNNLQQVAKEDIYRASEKLVYKFISNKLVFAYDDSKSLFLNSANILIPRVPNMGIKTVMAFLNSTLFQFTYIKLFGEVKILKGNLMELPFPEITTVENKELTGLVDDILNGDMSKREKIEEYVYSIYSLSQEQIKYIRGTVNGEIN